MVRTLVTGATGTLGPALRPRLTEAGHTVRAASRTPPAETTEDVEWVALDIVEDTGIESALEDVDVVIHAATAPQGETKKLDVAGTKRLLEAAVDGGVENSDVPTTIVPATQFHSFVAELFDYVAKLPVWPLPTRMQVQPVAACEVANSIVSQVTLTAAGRTDPVGGPDVHSVGELARAYRHARELRRPIFRVPLPGGMTAAFRAGHATCPKHTVGTVTWKEWLAETYARDTDDKRRHKQPVT